MKPEPILVLCVDDNHLMAEALKRRFEFEQRVRWAGWVANCVDTVRVVRTTRPDVVVLDIDMPGCDTFELVRELAEAAPDVRVIMFSGHVRSEYIDRAVEAGAWGYVSKNDDLDELINAILRVSAGEFVLSPDVELETRAT